MKKILLIGLLTLVPHQLQAAAGDCSFAGYDSSGKALYYDCNNSDVLMNNSYQYQDTLVRDNLELIDSDRLVLDEDPVETDACSGVKCPSDMSCSAGCCVF